MKYLALLLLLTIAVETAGLFLTARQVPPDFPVVDLSLLEDQVSVRAIQELRQSSDPRKGSDWKRLGEFYLAFGFYPQAEICFRVSMQLDHQDKPGLLLHALSLDRMGAKRLAIDAYRRAIEARAPTAKDFRIRIAQCLLTIGEDEQAVKELRRISERPDAQLLLSRILIRRNEIDEARRILLELQKRLPDYLEPFSMVSFAAEQAGDMQAARLAQDRSLRCDKNMIGSQLLRSDEMELRGRHSSLVYYEKSLELEGVGNIDGARKACQASIAALWEEDIVRSYALFELHHGNVAAAIQVLQAAIDRVGGSMELLDALGDAYLASGKSQSAIDCWLQATSMQGSAAIYAKIANVYSQSGNAPAAEQSLGMAEYERGKQSWLTNDMTQAQTHFQAAVVQVPDFAHAWYYLAETERILGHNDTARTAYQKCLDVDPNHGRAWHALQLINLPTGE